MSTVKEKQNIPKGWQSGSLLNCFDLPAKLPGLKLTEYEKDGEYPIFDQGQSYISGHSSHKGLLVENTPAILFGDHTRVVKFIESPFVPGADGTKILWAKDGFDSRYLYYALFNVPIPNTGYNRHFKFLKDKELVYPESKKEQQKIAEVLGAVDEEIEKTKEVIKATEKLKKGLMQKLFTQGIGHKNFKQTELGEIPESWGVNSIKNAPIKIADGNYSAKYPRQDEFLENGVPFVRVNNLQGQSLISEGLKYISPEKHTELKKGHLKEGDVLITTRGNLGIVALVPKEFEDANINAQIVLLRSEDENTILPRFLMYFLTSDIFRRQVFSSGSGSALKQLPVGVLEKMNLVFPNVQEQNQIIEILSAVDEKILVNKKLLAKQTELKKGLMQDLLSGVKRVRI